MYFFEKTCVKFLKEKRTNKYKVVRKEGRKEGRKEK